MSKIAVLCARTHSVQSNLQQEINHFVLIITFLAFFFSCLCLFVWAFFLRIYHPSFLPLSAVLPNIIAVIVAFVPEGLPLALSLGLALIARRLCLKFGVLVKSLGSIEGVGVISLLATDKVTK